MTPEEFAKVMSERNGDPTKRAKPHIQPPDSRPLGLVVCGVGLLGIGYNALTLDEALNHAPEITIMWKTFLVSVPAFLIGLRWVIFGRKAPEAFGRPFSPTLGAKIYYIACLIASPICAYAYVHYLHMLGYTLH